MKYVRILGLLTVAAASLTAFAAPAVATTITAGTGTAYTGTLTAESEGATSLHGPFTTVTCQKAHLEAKIEKHGAGVTAGGKKSTWSLTECNFPVTVLKLGSIEIHPFNCQSDHYCTGTVTTNGTEFTVQTSIASCIFTAESTDIGTLTPSNDTGGHATLDFNSAAISRTGHSFFCGSSGTLTGAYTVTTPKTLWIDP